jgi:Flp pilus assembly protein TadG
MRRQRGAVTLEFTLVGIPLIFALISIVEMARGMWIYHAQEYAVNAGARYIVVHGSGCSVSGNSCTVTVGNIATTIANAGIGLVPSQWNVTLYSASGTNNQTCNPLSSCLSSSTVWPPSPDNSEGVGVAVKGSYPFQSALAMFFPGTKPTQFGTFNLPAYAQHLIQF